jgi:predicted secreted Zn-dependent protease
MSTIPVGTVIDRPTGELALLWQAYARALEKQEELQRTIAHLKKHSRGLTKHHV